MATTTEKLSLTFALFVFGVATGISYAETDHPNIVYILADDKYHGSVEIVTKQAENMEFCAY